MKHKFSNTLAVVMAVNIRDTPNHILTAAKSVIHQTRAPDELIFVIDGPVKEEHNAVLSRLRRHENVKIIQNSINEGPGIARHKGIVKADSDIIAIMDADDISVPNRFEKQIELIANGQADVVGGWIQEFIEDLDDLKRIRELPEYHDDIKRKAKWRSPMNNVTCMFNKEIYSKVGGFGSMRSHEDYDLYVRMLLKNAVFYNIQEVLVFVRTGNSMIERRGGWRQVSIDTHMLFRMYKLGFLNIFQAMLSWVIRVSVRLMPLFIRRIFYTLILRKKQVNKKAFTIDNKYLTEK